MIVVGRLRAGMALSMLLSVQEMELHRVKFDVVVQPGRIRLPEDKFRQREAIRIKGTAELVNASEEIRVHGHISGVLEGICDRCLETSPLVIDRDFDLHYQPQSLCPDKAELQVGDEDTDIGYYEGDGVHLTEVLQEQLLLWLPMRWLCDENCKGLCPVCGQNRNRVACHCRQQMGDERWAALRRYQAAATK